MKWTYGSHEKFQPSTNTYYTFCRSFTTYHFFLHRSNWLCFIEFTRIFDDNVLYIAKNLDHYHLSHHCGKIVKKAKEWNMSNILVLICPFYKCTYKWEKKIICFLIIFAPLNSQCLNGEVLYDQFHKKGPIKPKLILKWGLYSKVWLLRAP